VRFRNNGVKEEKEKERTGGPSKRAPARLDGPNGATHMIKKEGKEEGEERGGSLFRQGPPAPLLNATGFVLTHAAAGEKKGERGSPPRRICILKLSHRRCQLWRSGQEGLERKKKKRKRGEKSVITLRTEGARFIVPLDREPPSKALRKEEGKKKEKRREKGEAAARCQGVSLHQATLPRNTRPG